LAFWLPIAPPRPVVLRNSLPPWLEAPLRAVSLPRIGALRALAPVVASLTPVSDRTSAPVLMPLSRTLPRPTA
jgi:hypothetical protein